MTKIPSINESEIKTVLTELLRHSDLSIDIGLSACRQLNGSGRYEACELGLKELLSRFVGSRHVGRVHAERLQAALQRLPMSDAIHYTKNFIDDNDIISNLDDETCKTIQLLLWEQAAKCHDAGEWNMCLEWYRHSLFLFTYGATDESIKANKERSENVAKLYRNTASCFLSLGKMNEAEEAAKRALEFDQHSMFSHFTLFKVLVCRGKEDDVNSSKGNQLKMGGGHNVDLRHALICLAAQHALEKCQRDVAMATLHHLASSGQNHRAKLTAYRCLIRLYLTICDGLQEKEGEILNDDHQTSGVEPMDEDTKINPPAKSRASLMEAAIESVKNAHQVLLSLKKDSQFGTKPTSSDDVSVVLPGDESHAISEEEFGNEITWFMKITWNMALQFNNNPPKMKELFSLCKEILALADVDQSILLRQKTCLLMCAACELDSARNAARMTQVDELENVMNIVGQCREICNDLARYEDASTRSNEDKSAVLLALYHFEALAKLTKSTDREKSEKLLSLFKEISLLPKTDAKTFETIAVLSMESPAHHPEICKLSLKTALKHINHHLERESSEAEKIQLLKKRSSLYRLLIDTILREGSPSDPSNKQESWLCFNEVNQLMQNENNMFPELDRLWFTVRCWNVGVRLFTANHVIEAEKWCALALRLLAQMERFRENYETHMNHAYREILAKKDVAMSRMTTVF